MMNERLTSTMLAAVLITAFVCGSTYAQDHERLMPVTEAAKISVSKRQDGLALHLTVKNDSAMVVTEIEFTCEFYDRSKPRPTQASNGKPWCTSKHFIFAGDTTVQLSPCALTRPLTYHASEQIRPGKSKEFYYEMGRDWSQVYQCFASELRAREARFWER